MKQLLSKMRKYWFIAHSFPAQAWRAATAASSYSVYTRAGCPCPGACSGAAGSPRRRAEGLPHTRHSWFQQPHRSAQLSPSARPVGPLRKSILQRQNATWREEKSARNSPVVVTVVLFYAPSMATIPVCLLRLSSAPHSNPGWHRDRTSLS